MDHTTRHKSLTLYPIELGGQWHLNSRDVHRIDTSSVLFPCTVASSQTAFVIVMFVV